MGERTAYNYMNGARFLEGKSASVANLRPATIYALAAPSAPVSSPLIEITGFYKANGPLTKRITLQPDGNFW